MSIFVGYGKLALKLIFVGYSQLNFTILDFLHQACMTLAI